MREARVAAGYSYRRSIRVTRGMVSTLTVYSGEVTRPAATRYLNPSVTDSSAVTNESSCPAGAMLTVRAPCPSPIVRFGVMA